MPDRQCGCEPGKRKWLFFPRRFGALFSQHVPLREAFGNVTSRRLCTTTRRPLNLASKNVVLNYSSKSQSIVPQANGVKPLRLAQSNCAACRTSQHNHYHRCLSALPLSRMTGTFSATCRSREQVLGIGGTPTAAGTSEEERDPPQFRTCRQVLRPHFRISLILGPLRLQKK